MYPRLLKINPNLKKSFFLFGPRGVGKTSWIKSQFTNSLYFDLLDAKTYRLLQSDPTHLEQLIPQKA